MKGSYIQTQEGIQKAEYWVIPFKGSSDSVDATKTVRNLVSNYLPRNIPSFTCSGPANLSGADNCVSSNGVYFKQSDRGDNMSGFNIPSKNGGIVLTGATRMSDPTNTGVGYGGYGIPSCRNNFITLYKLHELYVRENPKYPRLPYLLLEKETFPIRVTEYRSVPQF